MTETQQLMNLRLPAGDFVTAKDIAAATGFSQRTILNAINNGKFHGFQLNASRQAGQEAYLTTRIPRECAITAMVRMATYDAHSLCDDVIYCFKRMDKTSLARAQAAAARELSKR
jgi:biotin operon repressor